MKLRTSILSLGLATLLGAPAVADDPLRITDLAPESTFLVIGADDMDATCRHFEQTPLAGLWRTEVVQDLVGESFTDGIEMMMESLRDEGIESEPELPRSMGVAIHPHPLELDLVHLCFEVRERVRRELTCSLWARQERDVRL